MSDIFSFADIWNDAGTTFKAIQVDVTNTASAAASRLIDLKVGGVTKFDVDALGNTLHTGELGIDMSSNPNLKALSISGALMNGAENGKFVDFQGEWDTTGDPKAFYMDVSDSASGAASLLMELNVGGNPMFSVRKDGLVQFVGLLLNGAAGDAASVESLVVSKTGIADNTATTFLTLTVPNGSHGASLLIFLSAHNGSTDAFESTQGLLQRVNVARTTGVSAAAGTGLVGSLAAGIATVSAGATVTPSITVVANAEGVGGTETVSVKITIDDSGNVGSNSCEAFIILINSQGSGITMAAA